MTIRSSRLLGFLFLLLLSGPATSLAQEADTNRIYIAGFVKDSDGAGISDAIVVLTNRHQKLFSIRTQQKGWFESINPLDSSYVGSRLRITVIKSGFQLEHKDFDVDPVNNFHEIIMRPAEEFVSNADYSIYQTDVNFGRVVDQARNPIEGAIITVYEKGSKIPLSSAVSRESGYFSIHHSKTDPEKSYAYSIEHYSHDSRDGPINMGVEAEFLEVGLTQNEYRFSFGPAVHLQTTDRPDDKESGGALIVNLSIHLEPIVVVDRFIPRYRESGIIGFDIGIGGVPFRKTSSGPDDFDYIGVLAIGASYALGEFILPLRFGIAFNDTDKAAAYIGINIPFYYF